jgi:hypothetical protein
MAAGNNPPVGIRSRTIALRRKRKKYVDEMTQIKATRDVLTLEFCREAAVFADSRAYEGPMLVTARVTPAGLTWLKTQVWA